MRGLTGLRISLIVATLALRGTAIAQQNQPFQIDLIFRFNDDTTFYKPNGLHLEQAKRGFRFTLEQPATRPQAGKPAIPTRMLVAFDPGVASDPNVITDTLKNLAPLWRLGWEVGFVRADGHPTSYTTDETMLMGSLTPAVVDQPPCCAAQDEVKRLLQFQGRRVLLYVSTARPGGTSPNQIPADVVALEREAHDAFTSVYVVDGGMPRDSVSNTIGSRADFQFVPVHDYTDRYAFHAMTLHNAVAAAVKEARDFYVMTVNCPPNSCPDPQQPLQLTISDNRFSGSVLYDGIGSAKDVKLLVKSN